MTFKVDDWVVHPRHGVGQIVNIEMHQFDSGAAQPYYQIAIPNGTMWVQVDESASGLRKVTPKGELVRYREVLKSRPAALTEDHQERQIELADRLRQGSLQARCELVRDLSALGWKKRLNEANAAISRLATQVLVQEWAMAEDVPLGDAASEVKSLLKEGKSAYMPA
jgi:RNA polymerase-interacting CarD/CdnL/TRCF family regulator